MSQRSAAEHHHQPRFCFSSLRQRETIIQAFLLERKNEVGLQEPYANKMKQRMKAECCAQVRKRAWKHK